MSCPRKMVVSQVWLGPQIELTKLITLSNPTSHLAPWFKFANARDEFVVRLNMYQCGPIT